MPITFFTLGIASLAISGVPGFSGFFSKDAILAAAYESAPWMFWTGVATAGLTAFYVFRAYFLTFFGKYRGHHHPHESPLVMTFPLMVLALLSLGGGFLSVPHWLAPMFPTVEHEAMQPMIISSAFGIGGILLATLFYVIIPTLSDSLKSAAGPIYTLLVNKYYVYELYTSSIVKPLNLVSRTVLWRGVDEGLIDTGLVNGFAKGIQGLGSILRRWQSGSIRNYATWILAGSLLLIFVLGLATGGAR
jgi:NADH-quinone oxidoreductase subunit L